MLTRLLEIGKKISKANAAKLRKAWQEVSDILALAGEETKEATEAERSQSERATLLRDAVQAYVKGGADYGPWVYICDIYDTNCVYCLDGSDCYQVDYSIAEDGSVTLGIPVEVIPHMTYDPAPSQAIESQRCQLIGDVIPVQESAVKLSESAIAESATAEIKLIDPGWGSFGYYSPDVLKQYGPAAFPKGTHMYINHSTQQERAQRPEGSVDNIGAVLESDATWMDNGSRGPGLYATAKVGENFRSVLKDFGPDIGVSISADGERIMGEAGGKKGFVITKLDAKESSPFNSVDFVTIAGRGGEVVRLFEAAGRKPPAPIPIEESTTMTELEKTQLQEATTKVAQLTSALRLQESERYCARVLQSIKMPDEVRNRLMESLVMRYPVKDEKLDETAFKTVIEAEATRELEYINKLRGGTVRGMGGTAQDAKPATIEDLTKSFMGLGLSEAAAKIAARGREAA